MGKIVPRPNKNGVFFKLTKIVFTVLKMYLYNLNFSLKLQKKLLSFNTVKTVFVDLKKTQFLLGGGTIFPTFLTKKCTEKSWSQETAPFFRF